MEENKLIESKKILTDYMLELNRDIQSAEDWANTGADEEMYFALQTVLNELERLQKENKSLVKQYEWQGAILVNEYMPLKDIKQLFIPKQVVRNKIEEVNKEYKKYTEKWEKLGMNKEHPFYRYIVRLEAQIDILEELLNEVN